MDMSLEFINAIKQYPGALKTIPRIAYAACRNNAKSYLEIGVNKGHTFTKVELPLKVAVDPHFLLTPTKMRASGGFFFETESDSFFAALADDNNQETAPLKAKWPDGQPTFDIIFIDGLHTFEQSFRDFENSLKYSHDQTIWLLDDTVPCNPYSAFPDLEFSFQVREQAGMKDRTWHGDVFKTVFAIHDRYPEFSYCTLMGLNPQTVLWKAAPKGRKPAFSSLEEISHCGYYDMLKHANLLMPVSDLCLPELLGQSVNPAESNPEDMWRSLIYMNMSNGFLLDYF